MPAPVPAIALACGLPINIATTDEMVEAVNMYVKEVWRTLEHVSNGVLKVEEPLTHLKKFDKEFGGTADAVIVDPDGCCYLIDFKYGAGTLVEADCDQMKFYALGLWPYKPEEVTCVVVQPRAVHPSGHRIRHHTWTRLELKDFSQHCRIRAEATRAEDRQPTAGDWCAWCPRASCPALAERALSVAQTDFDELEAGSFQPPSIPDMTPEQMALILQHGDTLAAWLKKAKQYASDQAQKGVHIPGWKVVEGRKGNRTWTDELEAAAELDAQGIDPWQPPKIRSPADVEKEIGKKTFQEKITTTTRAPGKPQLAPESDKRPAIECGPQADFDEIT